MRNFQEIIAWQRSHQLTLKVYFHTNSFPNTETYGLVSQMRRAASSIPTNIAEGCGRNSDAEMKRFLIISTGSCSELEYQLILAKDLKYIPENLFKELQYEIILIRKMIFSFIKKLE
ncbi:MAG: four helix bundle protein [Chitinophagaceae bacterium]|jgi:four helix bundle protein|nr:MAG: four helix bundle protein [Chitinophagaceae bacterium]